MATPLRIFTRALFQSPGWTGSIHSIYQKNKIYIFSCFPNFPFEALCSLLHLRPVAVRLKVKWMVAIGAWGRGKDGARPGAGTHRVQALTDFPLPIIYIVPGLCPPRQGPSAVSFFPFQGFAH